MGLDLGMLMNLFGQAGNAGSQGLSQLNTVMDMVRYGMRNLDPLMTQMRDYNINRFNDAPFGPYGDQANSFDQLWGTRSDGSPVQYGDMAAHQLDYMLNNNPGGQATAQMSGLIGPSFADLFGGNPAAAGLGIGSGPKAMGVAAPTTASAVGGLGPVAPSTGVPGLGTSGVPEPALTPPGAGGGPLGGIIGGLQGAVGNLFGDGGGGGPSDLLAGGVNALRNVANANHAAAAAHPQTVGYTFQNRYTPALATMDEQRDAVPITKPRPTMADMIPGARAGLNIGNRLAGLNRLFTGSDTLPTGRMAAQLFA